MPEAHEVRRGERQRLLEELQISTISREADFLFMQDKKVSPEEYEKREQLFYFHLYEIIVKYLINGVEQKPFAVFGKQIDTLQLRAMEHFENEMLPKITEFARIPEEVSALLAEFSTWAHHNIIRSHLFTLLRKEMIEPQEVLPARIATS